LRFGPSKSSRQIVRTLGGRPRERMPNEALPGTPMAGPRTAGNVRGCVARSVRNRRMCGGEAAAGVAAGAMRGRPGRSLRRTPRRAGRPDARCVPAAATGPRVRARTASRWAPDSRSPTTSRTEPGNGRTRVRPWASKTVPAINRLCASDSLQAPDRAPRSGGLSSSRNRRGRGRFPRAGGTFAERVSVTEPTDSTPAFGEGRSPQAPDPTGRRTAPFGGKGASRASSRRSDPSLDMRAVFLT